MRTTHVPCTTEALEPRKLLSAIPYPSGFGPLQARLVAAVDFTADGQKDLLWQDHATGEVYVEVVTDTNNPTPTYTKHVLGVVDPNRWILEAAADFDGDSSKPDLLWFDTVTRRPAQWLIVALQPTAFRWMVTNPVAEGWRIEGVGNFDGDHDASDIVWRNYETGKVAIWQVSFDTPVGFTIFQGPETRDWAIELADDFNGDSKPDLLWRNYGTGKQCVWFMDNMTVTGFQMLNTFHTVPQAWDIEGRGDFNGDLWDDIIYRNYVTGEVIAWLMQNTLKIGERTLMTKAV